MKNKKIDKEEPNVFKIITLGDTYVGKTSIFKKYIYKSFGETKSTIGMNMFGKDLTLENNEQIKLRLIDTSGTERYKALSKQYFKNADAVLFVFAFDNSESFKNIKQWINIYSENNQADVPKYLIGNKNDLEKNVSEVDINEFLKLNKDFKFKSISAKNDDIKIDELFQEIGETLYKDLLKYGDKKTKSIKISSSEDNKRSTCAISKCFLD